MTEQEWLACTDPTPMLVFMLEMASERKLRLFACACCRRFWHLIPDGAGRIAVEVGELFADGGSDEMLGEAFSNIQKVVNESYFRNHEVEPSLYVAMSAADPHSFSGAYDVVLDIVELIGPPAEADERGSQSQLLRCILGNPFHPIVVDPSWLTSTVVALSEGIYQDRAFDRLPILADALQDAGCGNAEVLEHCWSPGPHVRGCHVLDLILGKS